MKTYQDLVDANIINLEAIDRERQAFEDEKWERIKKMVIIALVLFVPSLVVVLLLGFDFQYAIPLPGIVTGFGLMHYFNARKKQKTIIKGKLVGQMLTFIDPSYQYFPTEMFSSSLFRKGGFIKSWNIYTSEDLIKGSVRSRSFECGEVFVAEKKNNDRRITRFHGMVFAVDMPFDKKLKIDILPDSVEDTFGSTVGTAMQKMNVLRPHLVKFDNREFERQFVVYSNNEDEARSFVSFKLMEYLLNRSHPVYVSVHDGKLFLGLDNRYDLFRFDMADCISDPAIIERNFNDFQYLMQQLERVLDSVKMPNYTVF